MPPRPNPTRLPFFACLFCLVFAAPSFAAAPFGLKDVDALAKQRAADSFKDPGSNLPGPLKNLDHDRYEGIHFKRDVALWNKTKSPFALEFFHQGWAFDHAVAMHEIMPSGVRDLVFDPQQFDYAAAKLDPATAQGLGYAGFRAETALNLPAYRDEFISFLGASYFRALGKGQLYGISARGLAIDTAQASGEEFPRFVEFWVERPKANAQQLVVYGLLDSPRATGAYRFAITPGIETIVEVNAHIYLRDKIDKLGLAPLTSMFFHGPNERPVEGDFRPQVHDSDGLSIQSASGEWIWRPLLNPKRLLVTSFAQTDPRGFGLMQRARDFSRYEDLHTRYDLHPSAWVEPLGSWGKGRVELVMIPAPDETNDNIVAYWTPDQLPEAGKEMNFNYSITMSRDEDKLHAPENAYVLQTRRSTGDVKQSNLIRQPDGTIAFVVDFTGQEMSKLAPETPVTAQTSIGDNGEIVENNVRYNPVTKGWRLTLRVKLKDAKQPTEMRAALVNADQPLSETWSYQLPANE
jgi:glucans biosynthesis protein